MQYKAKVYCEGVGTISCLLENSFIEDFYEWLGDNSKGEVMTINNSQGVYTFLRNKICFIEIENIKLELVNGKCKIINPGT